MRFATALVLALLTLTGCSRRDTAVEAGIRDQTLLIGNGAEPQELDPQLVSASTDQILSAALFEGLCAIDETTSQAVPAVAERWETSADGLTWTFHLRRDAKWSNGEPLTAGDFVLSWQRILSPAFAAESAYYLFPIKHAEDINSGKIKDPSALGAVALDAHTLQITLGHPAPYLPGLAAQSSWYPVNLRAIEKLGTSTQRNSAWTRPENFVGNGPFVLKQWSPNARLIVEKNPHYWGAAQVALKQIVFFPTENPGVEERDFRAGQLHLTYELPLTKVDSYRTSDPGLLRVEPALETFFLRFNTTRAPLDNLKVRQALARAIDRETLARTVLRGTRRPAYFFTPPDSNGYTAEARIPDDFDAARALLAEAGYPGGKGFPVLDVQTRNDEIHTQLMEAIQAIWQRELGIKITVSPMEQKTWLQNQGSLNYAISTARWVGDFIDPVNYLEIMTGDGGYNWTGWRNAAYDTLIAQAAQTPEATARLALFQKAEAILLAEAPVAPVFFGARTYLAHPAVKNWPPALLGIHRFQKVKLEN